MANYYISSTKYSLQERMTRRGKVYDVVFRIVTLDGDEKQKKLSGYANKTLAKQAYTDFVTSNCELVKRNPLKKKNPLKEEMIFKDLLREYLLSLPNQNKANSIYAKTHIYKTFVLPFFGEYKIQDVTKEALYRWQDEIWSKKNPRTGTFYSYKYLINVRGHLSSFLSYCDSRYGYRNHMNEVAKPKKRVSKTKMKIWTREEFEKFIAVVDDPKFHCFFTLLFYTGRRKGEIFALCPSDIDLKKSTIVFDKSVTRKTLDDSTYAITTTKADKAQEIPICSIVKDELKTYKGESPFFFGGDRPLGDNILRRTFIRFCEKADIPVIRIHDLRHSFVSMLLHLGANFMVVADLIGDTVDQVIKTYGHLYESDKREIIEKLGQK